MSVRIQGSLEAGTLVSSKTHQYRIIKVLGVGGFGITYKVERLSDGRIMAMKEFFPSSICERAEGSTTISYLKTNAEAISDGIEDFVTEARRLSRRNISHPNIVEVEEVFKGNDTAYYTMEYVEGKNLLQYIRDNKNKPMSEEQALSVMRPLLQAVALLHSHMLAHLDIKHQNVVLSSEGQGIYRPVLIDFGQAKHYDKKGNATSKLTNAGCSPGFAPQEQYLGLTKFTPQADVYALGATLLFLLTAKVPEVSSEISNSKILGMFGSLPVSDRVKDAILAGMRKDMNDRTASVKHLADNLGLDISIRGADTNVTKPLAIVVDDTKNKIKELGKYFKPIGLGLGIAAILALIIIAVVKISDRPKEETETLQDELTPAGDEFGAESEDKWYVIEDSIEENVAAAEPLEENVEEERNILPKTETKTENEVRQREKDTEKERDKIVVDKSSSLVELRELADKGVVEAYPLLAVKYFNSGNNEEANFYAKKTLASGSTADKRQAIAIIERLDVMGYYDNGEHGGKPKY